MNGYMDFVANLQETGQLPKSMKHAAEMAGPIWQNLTPEEKAVWKIHSKASVKAILSPEQTANRKLQRNNMKVKRKLERFERLKQSGCYDDDPEDTANTPTESCDQNKGEHELAAEEMLEHEPSQSNIALAEQDTSELESLSTTTSEIRSPGIDETMGTPTMGDWLPSPNRARSFSLSAVGRGVLMKDKTAPPGIDVRPGQNSDESSSSLFSLPPDEVMKLNDLVKEHRNIQLCHEGQSLPHVATEVKMEVAPISSGGLPRVKLDVTGTPPPPSPNKLQTEEKRVEKTETEILNEFRWNGEGDLETCIGNWLSLHEFKESDANVWDSLDEYSEIMRPRRAKAIFIGKVYAQLESQQMYNKQFIAKVDSDVTSVSRTPSQSSGILSQENSEVAKRIPEKTTTKNPASHTLTELCMYLDDQDTDFIEPKKRGLGRGKPL